MNGKYPHFAIPEIYGETMSYYELLRKLVKEMNVMIENYDTIPDQIAAAVKNLDASQLFSEVLNQFIDSIATDNTKSTNAVKVYKKHDLLYATFNETVNLYESLIDFSTGTETELIIGTNIREVNISELFIELRKLIYDEALARTQADTALQTNIDNEAQARTQADTALQTNIDNEAQARTQADNTKANKSDVLTIEEIQATTDLTGKIASASALNAVRALKDIIITDITGETNIAQLESGLYFIGGAYSPINGVAGAFNALYLILVHGPWRYEIAISANTNSIYYRFYNPSDGIESWLKITGVTV